jgi:hypothetical protein
VCSCLRTILLSVLRFGECFNIYRTGFRVIPFRPFDTPVFAGVWFNPATRAVEEDRISIAFTDVLQDTDTDPALLAAIEGIRQTMFDAYPDVGSPQADVWVTVEVVKTSS